MDDQNRQLSEAIRSGRYYQEARGWFQTVYIGLLSERTFFLLIAVLSIAILLISLRALTTFMPLTERPPAVIKVQTNIDTMIPKLVKIRQGREDVNEALQRFYLEKYVTARESYNVRDFNSNVVFVFGNSASPVYEAYQAEIDPSNAQSYAVTLGETSEREVTIESVKWSGDGEQRTAEVRFAASINGAEDNVKSRWTAKLEYTYREFVATTVVDDEGLERIETTEPQFQVVSYAIESR